MKEEMDMPRLDVSKNKSGFLRFARTKIADVSNHPTDEDVSKIAAMPVEKIKSELAQMGVLDIPIPTLSSLPNGFKVSSTCEVRSEQGKSVARSQGTLRETRFGWLGSQSSPPLRIGMSLVAVTTLMLIVSNLSILVLSKLRDSAVVPVPAAPSVLGGAAPAAEAQNDKLVGISQPANVETKTRSGKQNPVTDVVGNRSSLQQTSRKRRKTEVNASTVARLEIKGHKAINPENRAQPQRLPISNILRLVLRAKDGTDKLEDSLASGTKLKDRANE